MQQQESTVQQKQEEQHHLLATTSPQQAENNSSIAMELLMTPPMPQTFNVHRQISFEDSTDNYGPLPQPTSLLAQLCLSGQEGVAFSSDFGRRIVPQSSNDNDQYALSYFCSPEPNTFNTVDYSPPALQQPPRKSVGQPRTNRVIGNPNSSPKSSTYDVDKKAMEECSTCGDLQDSSCQHLQCQRRRHMEANLYQKTDSQYSNLSSKVDSQEQMLLSLQKQKMLLFSPSGGSGDGQKPNVDSQFKNNKLEVSLPQWLMSQGQDEMCQCRDSWIKTPQSVAASTGYQHHQEGFQKGVQRFQGGDESAGEILLKGVLSPKLDFCYSNVNLPDKKLLSNFEVGKKQSGVYLGGSEEESTMTTSCNNVASSAVTATSKEISETQQKTTMTTATKMSAASLLKNMAIDFNPVSPMQATSLAAEIVAQKSHEKLRSTVIATAKSSKKVSSKKSATQQRNLLTPAANPPTERVHIFYSGQQAHSQQQLFLQQQQLGNVSSASKKQQPDFVINDSMISSAVTRPHYFDHLRRTFDQQLLSASSSTGQHQRQQRLDEEHVLLDFDQNSENTSQLNNEALLRPFNVDSIQLKKPLGGKTTSTGKTNNGVLGGVGGGSSSCTNDATPQENKAEENHWHKADRAISEISKNSSDDDDDDNKGDDREDQSDLESFDRDENCSQGETTTKDMTSHGGPHSKLLQGQLAGFESAELLAKDASEQESEIKESCQKRCGIAATFEQAMKSRKSWQSQQEESRVATRTMQMDRFIPCRTVESVQAKFEAASQNQQDFWQKEGPSQLRSCGARQHQAALRPRQQHTSSTIIQQATTISPSLVQSSNDASAPASSLQPTHQTAASSSVQQQMMGSSSQGYHLPRQLQQSSTAAALSTTQSQGSSAAATTGVQLLTQPPLMLSQQQSSSGTAESSDLIPAAQSSIGRSIRRLEPVIDTQHSLSSSLSPLGDGPATAATGASTSASGGRIPPLENTSPFLKPTDKANASSEKLQSYNYLLEKSIFYESQAELGGAAQQTNLTTDIDKDASLMQGLSLMYQTSCKTAAASRQNSSPMRRHLSAATLEHQMDDSLFMKENQTQASSLQASKILTFKKSLSMNVASTVKKDPTVAILGETQRKSIVAEYSSMRPLLDSPMQTRQRDNPLSSMDYLTAETTSHQSRHQVASTGSSTRGGGGGSNPDNMIVNKVRKIATQAYKILDAPALCDDFYLNLVDWSSTNILAVALGQCVFIWNANTSRVTQLVDLGERSRVTSVSWSQKGTHLCVGTHNGQVQIWDVAKQRCVRIMSGHDLRVSACAWSGSLVASGSKDKSILVRDVRAQSNFHQRLTSHRQEVCGLRWSPHDEQMLASGGNDNKLMIWNVAQNRSNEPLARFDQHQAAVKAINWSPLHRGLLATGGGTADQHIRFWNTINLQPISSINTGSQVCNLIFSKTNDELVSTHGYSLNQVIVWKYPTMEKIATLTGHTFRVLYLAMSPDGSSIVTGAGDETLRFWNIFPKSRSNRGAMCGNDIVGSGTSQLFPSGIDFR